MSFGSVDSMLLSFDGLLRGHDFLGFLGPPGVWDPQGCAVLYALSGLEVGSGIPAGENV